MTSAAAQQMLITAVEPSADALGARFMRAYRELDPQASFFGCGGDEMRGAGLDAVISAERFAVVGPAAALMAAPQAAAAANRLAQLAFERRARAAVLIDSWSFSSLVASRLRAISPRTKLYKYVAPQVFASRPWRAKKAAELFDGVMTLFAFEAPFFEAAGALTACVGNPVLQAAVNAEKAPEAFRARHGLGDAPLLLMLPGSRTGEIRRHAAPFGDCYQALRKKDPNLRGAIVAARAVAPLVRTATADWTEPPLIVDQEEKLDAFAAATAALAASGTVTSELAACGTPMVIAYRTHPLTGAIIRRIVTVNHLGLINIAAGREIAPERLLAACNGPALAAALAPLLSDADARRAQIEAFGPALSALGLISEDAAVKAAETVHHWLNS